MSAQPAQYSSSQLFYPSDWKEFMQSSRPGGAGAFSAEDSDDVLVGIVPARKLRDAIRKILGYSYASPQSSSTVYTMYRQAPSRHPELPWLYAKSLSYEPFAPRGSTLNQGAQPYLDAVLVQTETPANEDDPNGTQNQPTKYLNKFGNYEYLKVTVKFWQPPFNVVGNIVGDYPVTWDSTAHPEWTRFTEMFNSEPRLEILQADNVGVLRWAETGTGGPSILPATDPPNGNAGYFPVPLGVYQVKIDYKMKWWYVPADYVELNFNFPKINPAIGSVNSGAIFQNGTGSGSTGGFAEGTLLLMPPIYEKFRFPVETTTGEPLFYYNITLPFSFFDPDPAKGRGSSAFVGHNLMPFRGGGTNGGPGYFAASRDTTATPPSTAQQYRYLPSYDFNKIFQHVSQP